MKGVDEAQHRGPDITTGMPEEPECCNLSKPMSGSSNMRALGCKTPRENRCQTHSVGTSSCNPPDSRKQGDEDVMQGTDIKRRLVDALALLFEEGPVQGAQVLRHCRKIRTRHIC